MENSFKIHIKDNCHGRQVTMISKLSNHNIAMLRFTQDGYVLDGDSSFFGKNSHNWWTMMYIGPWWKRWFVSDAVSSGTTERPLEGLMTCKRMLRYFMTSIMGENEVIEISGSTLQRDEIYAKALKNMGFRYTFEYNDTRNIIIYVNDSFINDNPEIIINEFGKSVLNPKNAWGQLRLHGVSFPDYTSFDEEDYDYKHHTLLYEALIYIPAIIWEKIKQCTINLGSKLKCLWCDIKKSFINKPKRHRRNGIQN